MLCAIKLGTTARTNGLDSHRLIKKPSVCLELIAVQFTAIASIVGLGIQNQQKSDNLSLCARACVCAKAYACSINVTMPMEAIYINSI